MNAFNLFILTITAIIAAGVIKCWLLFISDESEDKNGKH